MPTSTFHSGLPFMSHAASTPTDPKSATTRVPSVTGVEFACADLVWRFTFGTPTCATCSHRIFPDLRSSA